MRIEVTYAGEAPRIIETAGESLLSSSVMASAPDWAPSSPPVCAVQMRPRTDLIRQGRGLMVEICAWSAEAGGGSGQVADYGQRQEVPRLVLHPFRVWEVLPAAELERAVAVDIDGRVHLRRVAGELVDLTAYELVESRVLSGAERAEGSLYQRVLLVHERLRDAGEAATDEEAGEAYGLGTWLFDRATQALGADDGASLGDGLNSFAEAYGSACTHDELVEAVEDAMLDVDGLTLPSLRRACERRGLPTEGLDDLWHEASQVG